MPARPTVPTALKILKGTDQPCRINSDEPEYDTENIDKPCDLSPKASEKWDEMVRIMQSVKVLTIGDIDTLKNYCETCVLLSQINEMIMANPIIYDDHGIPGINPLHLARDKENKNFLAYARELGLTPASRTKVKTTEKKKNASGFGGI